MLRRLSARVPRRTAALPTASASARPSLSAATVASARAMASLAPVTPPLSTALPSDAFQLLPESAKAGAAEDALYEQQVRDVEAWWATERFRGIKRPYSAEDVVSKRGSQQQQYPSSTMARKLWNLVRERESKGEPIHTSESPCPPSFSLAMF